MFNIAEFRQKPDRLTDLLPWAALVAPGVILNKDGSFQRTIQYRGPDLASSTDAELIAKMARLNNALKRLGSDWALYIEARRHTIKGYLPEGDFKDPVSWMVDLERRELFEKEPTHYESLFYITFQYMPAQEKLSRFSHWFVKGEQGSANTYHKSLAYFIATVDRIVDILSDFMFEVVSLNDNEVLTYLHSCISDKEHPITPPEASIYLDGVLADTPLVGGMEPKLGRYHLRTVSIKGFPTHSVPAILDQLNYLSVPYRWVTRFLPLDHTEAEGILKNYKRQWFAKRKGLFSLLSETLSKRESAMMDTAAVGKAQDADAALQTLADHNVTFGYYTATVTVWDENLQVVDELCREIERVINGLGFSTVVEQLNAVEAWLSSLPGQAVANVRMPLLHTLNLAHLIPFSAVWSGAPWNQHLNGPPLMLVRSIGDTPFRYSNHIHDVGHQMIIGPTGAGKSVFMNMMALQFLRYPHAQVFIFDKGGSALASTLGVGGTYYEVGGKSSKNRLVFQPLAQIHEYHERVWATDWILGLLKQSDLSVDPDMRESIWSALESLANLPIQQRTMTGFCALVQHQKVRAAVELFTLAGPYGEIFDADSMAEDKKVWQCFEMEVLMQMPETVAPALGVIFHTIEQRFDGRPTLLILDEAWLFMSHPLFAAKIREWLKTLRKQNVSVVFATQSVEDALNSPLSSALLESCPSRVFLPNDRALEPSIAESYIALGLNEKQTHIIAHALPKRQYYFQSSFGNALFDLALGPIALAFAGASQPERKKLLWSLYNEHKQPLDFLEHYFMTLKMNWAIDILKSYSLLKNREGQAHV